MTIQQEVINVQKAINKVSGNNSGWLNTNTLSSSPEIALLTNILALTDLQGSFIDKGTATDSGAATIGDSSKKWEVDALKDFIVVITAGTGVGQLRTIASNTASEITVNEAWGTALDTTSEYKLFGSAGGAGSAISGVQPTFHIGVGFDGNAAFSTTTKIATSGVPFTVEDGNCYITYIYYKPNGGTWQAPLINGADDVSITASADDITVTGAGTPFASGDEYVIGILQQKKAFDSSTNSNLTSVLNPDPDHQTDALPLQASALAIAANTTWYTIGSSVPCATYNKGKVYIIYTDAGGGDALNLRFRILFKDENGGQESPANESFVTITGVATTFDGVIANNYYECTEDGSAVICIHLELDNTVGEFEIEASCSDIGTGDDPTITATYRLGY